MVRESKLIHHTTIPRYRKAHRTLKIFFCNCKLIEQTQIYQQSETVESNKVLSQNLRISKAKTQQRYHNGNFVDVSKKPTRSLYDVTQKKNIKVERTR